MASRADDLIQETIKAPSLGRRGLCRKSRVVLERTDFVDLDDASFCGRYLRCERDPVSLEVGTDVGLPVCSSSNVVQEERLQGGIVVNELQGRGPGRCGDIPAFLRLDEGGAVRNDSGFLDRCIDGDTACPRPLTAGTVLEANG